MTGTHRLRRVASYMLFAAFAIAAVSCNEAHPNTTLVPHSDFGREIDFLWDRLLLLGTIVFVLVEGVLVFVVIKYRRRTPFEIPLNKFARDLQDRLGILALLALSAPFRICKLQILLATRETDPVSGHHLGSMTYEVQR